MGVAPDEVPYLKLPHHTIIELTPGPFGTEVRAALFRHVLICMFYIYGRHGCHGCLFDWWRGCGMTQTPHLHPCVLMVINDVFKK